MTFILTAAGVVLTFTLLRLLGNEREYVQRRRESEAAAKAAEAVENSTADSTIQAVPPKPAAAPPAKTAKPAPSLAPAKKAA
jgi:hypothetical protein